MIETILRKIKLQDGRQLAYAEYGESNGKPLMYFHGLPGSRLECFFEEALLQRLDIRLIIPDRPGLGESDPNDGYQLLDFADDVEQLANALGLKQFSILGFSIGGLFALACAYKLSDRLASIGVTGCHSPLTNANNLNDLPPNIRGLYKALVIDPTQVEQQLAPLADNPEGALEVMLGDAAQCDKKNFAKSYNREMYVNNLREGMRQGMKAIVGEMQLLVNDWGFKVEDIDHHISVWHGCDDQNTNVEASHHLKKMLPLCSTHFIDGEGHFTPYFNHAEAMLSELISD